MGSCLLVWGVMGSDRQAIHTLECVIDRFCTSNWSFGIMGKIKKASFLSFIWIISISRGTAGSRRFLNNQIGVISFIFYNVGKDGGSKNIEEES